MTEMYEELIKQLRIEAEPCERSGCVQTANEMRQAADAIESLSKELMDLKLLTCSCCEVQEENKK